MCSADTASSTELVGVKICRQPTYGSGRRGALMGTCVLWGHAKGNTCFSWGLRVACPHNICPSSCRFGCRPASYALSSRITGNGLLLQIVDLTRASLSQKLALPFGAAVGPFGWGCLS